MAFLTTKNLKGDIFGGVTAGIVALPLALAFGIQAFSGIGPEGASIGAYSGLVGATLLGFFAAATVGAIKLISLSRGIASPLVTSSPYFYLALTCMILGTQLFLTGFLGELVSRSSTDRNDYQIKETL